MVYSYTPTYYSTLHDSITSLCKNLLPLSFKRWRLPTASDHHRLLRLQSDNLKWQQNSFHQMLNLMGLHREGILAQNEVSTFSSHLLDTLISSPPEQDHPLILRDKLVFLQELFYAKCISEEDYHASKRPLMERLSVQGAEIERRDVIIGGSREGKEKYSEREWSIIELKDEQCFIKKGNSDSKNRSKIKGAASSVFSFGSSHKPRKNRTGKSIFDSPSLHLNSAPPKFSSTVFKNNEFGYSKENPFWNSESKGHKSGDKSKRKPFRTLFRREHREGHNSAQKTEDRSAKKQGFKKWKNIDSDDDTTPLPLYERSDSEACLMEQPDTNIMKNTLYSDASPSDILIDKVCGDTIKELSLIKTGQSTTNPNQKITQRYGDGELDAKTQSKINIREMENMCINNNAIGKHNYSLEWTTFEDDENLHPNLFVQQDGSFGRSSTNPFCQ